MLLEITYVIKTIFFMKALPFNINMIYTAVGDACHFLKYLIREGTEEDSVSWAKFESDTAQVQARKITS